MEVSSNKITLEQTIKATTITKKREKRASYAKHVSKIPVGRCSGYKAPQIEVVGMK